MIYDSNKNKVAPESVNQLATMINGVLQDYQFCATQKDAYDKYPIFKKLEYLGTGMLCDELYHFWKLRDVDRSNSSPYTNSSRINSHKRDSRLRS